jgi:chromosome segregation ATPase
MKRLSALLLVAALAVPGPWSIALAQQTLPPAAQQELARTRFRELSERMQTLQAILAKTDPKDSKLVGAGILFVREKKIQERMAQAKTLLDQQRWDDGESAMKGIATDLRQLLELLQNRNLDLQQLLEKIAQLQGFRDEVDRLAKEQGKEKEDSARSEALQQQLEALQQAKTKAEQLLAEQQQLRAQTNDLGLQAAAEATRPLEEKEGQLKDRTNDLAKDLESIEKKAAELASKPGEGKPGENGESKPNEGQPGGGSPGAGSSSAKGAAQSMQQAQQQLGDRKPEPSLKDQDQAIEQLKSTVQQLEAMAEEARRELQKLPFELQAKNQEQTEHATDTLAQKMEQAEQQGEDGAGEPTPGRRNVQQAVPKQKAAAGQLKEYKPAKQKQQDAKEDLEKAREELDEALAQLRQQLQDEVLRALEERFTAMLAKQRELSLQTKTLDKTRDQMLTADGGLPAAMAERIQTVAAGEQDLEVEAGDALKLLEEEGTTAVFPEIVADLKDQLHGVARLCRANETGKHVQDRQAEVEDTLALLINALRRTIERRDGG